MKKTNLLICLGALAAFTAQAQTVLLHDSFETYDPGFNQPDSSTSEFQGPVAPSGQSAVTQVVAGNVAGQDGSQYLVINTSGSDTSTDSISTKVNAIGKFSLATTYTASVLMAQSSFGGDGSPGDLFNGVLSLVDDTTGTTLDSVTHNFATGTTGFASYSFSFDTLTSPALAGDDIQLKLTADVNTASFQDTLFDNLKLTATPDIVNPPVVPEPTTCVLLGLGAIALLVTARRRA